MRHSREGFNVVDKINKQRTKSMIEMETEIAAQEKREKEAKVAASKRRKTEMPKASDVSLAVNEISSFAEPDDSKLAT